MKIMKFLTGIMLSVATSGLLAGYADDRAEIVNLSNKYMVAVDAGDIETVMDTWAEDGNLVWVFGNEHGKDEIRKAMSGFGGARYEEIEEGATKRPRTRHQIINHVVDIEGNTATTTAYWFALTNRTTHGNVEPLYFGHYEDVLEKINGEWKFKVRKVYNESYDNSALYYPELGEVDPRTRKPE